MQQKTPALETGYGFGVELDLPVEEAVARATSALQAEGFGVLTTIDVRQTLKNKLGVEIPPYQILGACNPALAHRGLQADPNLGLLLPCNVIVQAVDGRSRVIIVDPLQMLGVASDSPELTAVADEAAQRLRRVVARLADES